MGYSGNIPEPLDEFYKVIETLWDEETIKLNREYRERLKKLQQEEAAAHARAAAEVAAMAAVDMEELTLQFVLWQSSYETDILTKKKLTTFPHLPYAACICKEVSCVARKQEPGSLRACQHDVERLLRASGLYSLAWLRKERLLWHPDRFGQRCDPDFRPELRKKATELYAIFEVLIEAEKGGPVSP